jgi:hypothetical protein
MYWYTIEIPRHDNGDIAKYPPNWFGVMDLCPKNVTVKIFNDKEGWLLAECDDDFIPPEVKVITEAEALKLMSQTQQAEDVFVGVQKIADRWAKLEADRLAEKAIMDAKLFDAAIEKVLDGR